MKHFNINIMRQDKTQKPNRLAELVENSLGAYIPSVSGGTQVVTQMPFTANVFVGANAVVTMMKIWSLVIQFIIQYLITPLQLR
jgi:hypothetical protein